MLTFDEPSHTYRWNDVVVPSVTQVLKPLTSYDHVKPDALERARQEGTAIHYMVECDCKRIAIDLPDWMKGHWEAWQKFVAETGFECWASEQRGYHALYRYAGTMDLVGELKHLSLTGPTLLDVKRSFYGGPTIGLQLAAYQKLLEQDKGFPKIKNRLALRLMADGKYQLLPFTDANDGNTFFAQLALHNWKTKHGKHD